MFSVSHKLNAAQAETYYEESYSRDDYYSEGHTCAGRWMGQGAARMGLTGAIDREQFSALLQGRDPHTKEILVAAATQNGRHIAGWDGTFSAPKSVSLQALVFGDERLIGAHTRAVEKALAQAEPFALSGKEPVITGNILAAAFDHLAARPTKGHDIPDPQLHTHVLLLNMTQRDDGKWRALRNMELVNAQRFISAVYRSELAQEVQKLGYRIQKTHADGRWELERYNREQVLHFSRRRQEIEQRMEETGLRGAKAQQIFAYSTRQAKGPATKQAQLTAAWQADAAANGIDGRPDLELALKRGDQRNGTAEDCRRAVEFAVRHLIERDAVVDAREIQTAALQFGMGRVTPEAIGAQIQIEETEGRLIRAQNTGWRHPRGAFTTPQTVQLERENLELVEHGKNRAQAIASAPRVWAWAALKRLEADQRKAAQVTLASHDWATALEGYAGATKTTVVGAFREFAEGQGYTVRGFGITTTSKKALEEAGVKARTIESLLHGGLPDKKTPELWVVDESSLIGLEKFNQILNLAKSRAVERLVFVGDQGQHQSISAGAPMRQALDAGMTVAHLTNIRRQRDPEYRRAVELARDKPAESVDLLHAQGRVVEISDKATRYQHIAADFLNGYEAKQNVLVVSPGNDERHVLNAVIRESLVARGHVNRKGIEHDILVHLDRTKEELLNAGSFEVGNIVHFNRGSKLRGIRENSYWAVENIDHDRNLLALSNGSQRRTVNPSRYAWAGMQIYDVEQRTFAKGDRIQFRAPDNHKKRKIANGEYATILKCNDQAAKLRFDTRTWFGLHKTLTLPLSELRHIDLGYCSTSHTAQGATVDRVIVNGDSTRSDKLISQQQHYVSISRGRDDATIYTDSLSGYRDAVQRNPLKATALEAVQPRSVSNDAIPPAPAPQQKQGRFYGFKLSRAG